MRVRKPRGSYLSGNARLSTIVRSLVTSWFSSKEAGFAFARETRAELLALKEMIEEGSIRSIVDRVYSMDEASAAHRRVEAEERLGAVVIGIADRDTAPRSDS